MLVIVLADSFFECSMQQLTVLGNYGSLDICNVVQHIYCSTRAKIELSCCEICCQDERRDNRESVTGGESDINPGTREVVRSHEYTS